MYNGHVCTSSFLFDGTFCVNHLCSYREYHIASCSLCVHINMLNIHLKEKIFLQIFLNCLGSITRVNKGLMLVLEKTILLKCIHVLPFK